MWLYQLALLCASTRFGSDVAAFSTPSAADLVIRVEPATTDDMPLARKLILKEKMNPLSMSAENMMVARNDEDVLLGFGQVRSLDDTFAELASVFVLPEYRRQGVATEILKELLVRHDLSNPSQKVCLLTLKPTTPLYEAQGFRLVDDMSAMPKSLQVEFALGNAVSFILQNELVCMCRKT